MKEIFLNGAAFADNFGDILFFQIFSEIVVEEGYRPTMYSMNKEIMKKLPNVYFYDSKFTAIKNADKVAYVGGGYFGEQPNPKWIYRFRWGLQNIRRIQIFGLLAMIFKKEIGIFGAGAGKVTNPITKFLINKIITNAKIVIVRDKESRDALLNKRIDNSKIVESVDTVLAIDSILSDIKKSGQKKILLHLSDSPEYDIVSKVLWNDVSKYLRENLDYTCTIITDHFNGGQKRSYDYFKGICDNISQLSVYRYTNTTDLIELIAKSDYVITNKLHVGVVGISYNKKVISIPNHPKVYNLFRQLGIEKRLISKENIHENVLFNLINEIKNDEVMIDSNIKKQAIGNIDQFRNFIS